MLTDEQFKGKWNEIKGGIRNLWGRLRDDELETMKEDISKVSELVEDRYGETKEEIKNKMKQLLDSFDNDSDKNIAKDESSYKRSPLGPNDTSDEKREDNFP